MSTEHIMNSAETMRQRFIANAARREFVAQNVRLNNRSFFREHLPRDITQVDAALHMLRAVQQMTLDRKIEMLLSNGANIRLVMDAYEMVGSMPRRCVELHCNRPMVTTPQQPGKHDACVFSGYCWRHACMHPLFEPAEHRMPDKLRREYHRLVVLRGVPERDYMRGRKKNALTKWEAAERGEAIVSHWLQSIGYTEDGTSRRR